MAEEKKHSGTKDQMDKHVHDILSVLSSIDSHLASMDYYQQPSRGFSAGIEKAIAQPFVSENKDSVLENMIREEIKKALGDK